MRVLLHSFPHTGTDTVTSLATRVNAVPTRSQVSAVVDDYLTDGRNRNRR